MMRRIKELIWAYKAYGVFIGIVLLFVAAGWAFCTFDFRYFKEAEHNGHTYLIYRGTAMTHDPDCACGAAVTTENAP